MESPSTWDLLTAGLAAGDLHQPFAAWAFLVLQGLVRDAPFGKGSTETGLALTLAFLMRHGVMIDAEDEEIAGISLGMADGQVFAGMVEMWMREYIGRGF